jgi:Protein of unknown function (DUF742)
VTSDDDRAAPRRPEDEELWFDDAAGPLVRVFAVTKGRTRSRYPLDMVTLVMATSRSVELPPTAEHAAIVGLCPVPLSVAEVAATMNLPLASAKVLISDLVEVGAMTFMTPQPNPRGEDHQLIRTVIDAIRQL